MRKLIWIVCLAGMLTFAGAAMAEETTSLYCICMPYCCEFDCVMVDIDCKCCCPSNAPLTIEFLGRDGVVLGTAVVPNYCCLCDEYQVRTNQKVNAGEVCSIRLRKADNACDCIWLSLRVYCSDPCSCCGKWHKVFKGDVWCWQPVPVVAPPVEPPVVEMPAPAPAPVPVVTPAPEPEHDYTYFPPEEEETPEVIVVEGRG